MKTSKEIATGNIVKAITSAKFLVLGIRWIDGEEYAQLKTLDSQGKVTRGELSLPIAVLKVIA